MLIFLNLAAQSLKSCKETAKFSVNSICPLLSISNVIFGDLICSIQSNDDMAVSLINSTYSVECVDIKLAAKLITYIITFIKLKCEI